MSSRAPRPETTPSSTVLPSRSRADPASFLGRTQELELIRRLLADAHPHGAVSRAYGVYDEQTGLSSRTLFVLDEHGIIRWSQASPAAINPGVDGILTALEALGAPEADSDGASLYPPSQPDASRSPRPRPAGQPEDHRQ